MYQQAIPKRYLREIYELGYFSKPLCQNCTERSEQSFGSGSDVCDGECAVSLDPFSLVGVGIYEWSFTSESTVRVDLVEAHFHSDQRVASFDIKSDERGRVERGIQ